MRRGLDGCTLSTQWTSFNPGKPITFLADVSAFRMEDGALALFFSACMIGDSVCAEGLRMLEGSRHSVASFALFNLAGKLLEQNAAFIREFGEEPAAGDDHFLTLFVDRDEGDRIRSEIVTRTRFRSRGDRWMSFDLIPHAGDDGIVKGAFVFGYDIHALKMAESGLKSHERRMSLMADNLPVGVMLLDLEMRIRFANAILCRWYGMRPDAIICRHASEIIGEAAFEETRSRLRLD